MPLHQEDHPPEQNSTSTNPRPKDEVPEDKAASKDNVSPEKNAAKPKDNLSDVVAKEAKESKDPSPKSYPIDNSPDPDNKDADDEESIEVEPPSKHVDELAKQQFHSEQTPDLTAPPLSDDTKLKPRLLFVKVKKRNEKGHTVFNVDGEKLHLKRSLSDFLEALIIDDEGPENSFSTEDDFVRWKSADELTRILSTSRNNLHNMAKRLNLEFAEQLFLPGDAVQRDPKKGFQIRLVSRRNLA